MIYIRNGYIAYVIVPTHLLKTAQGYLPKHRKVIIITFRAFKGHISEYARILRR